MFGKEELSLFIHAVGLFLALFCRSFQDEDNERFFIQNHALQVQATEPLRLAPNKPNQDSFSLIYDNSHKDLLHFLPFFVWVLVICWVFFFLWSKPKRVNSSINLVALLNEDIWIEILELQWQKNFNTTCSQNDGQQWSCYIKWLQQVNENIQKERVILNFEMEENHEGSTVWKHCCKYTY